MSHNERRKSLIKQETVSDVKVKSSLTLTYYFKAKKKTIFSIKKLLRPKFHSSIPTSIVFNLLLSLSFYPTGPTV